MNNGAALPSDARLLLAVDGGGTKTDVVLVDVDGRVVTRRIGPAAVPQVHGVDASLDAIMALAAAACTDAGIDRRRLEALAGAVFFQAGIDLAVEQATYDAAARERLDAPVLVENDALAVLHAGLPEGRGVAVVCGTGANAVVGDGGGVCGRYPALGEITGDRAGGFLLGRDALLHAARSEDGRGRRTQLERRVPERFGYPTPRALAEALHLGQLPRAVLSDLVPVVLAAAGDGDAVAAGLVDDLGDELARMVVALVRRLDVDTSGRNGIPVVLGGGVLQAGDTRLLARIRQALERALPRARVRMLDRPPVAGSAAVALRLVGAPPQALDVLGRVEWPRHDDVSA